VLIDWFDTNYEVINSVSWLYPQNNTLKRLWLASRWLCVHGTVPR